LGAGSLLSLGATCTTNSCCSFRAGNSDGTKAKGYFRCQAKGGQIRRALVKVKNDLKEG
jgi:hypothetical protein